MHQLASTPTLSVANLPKYYKCISFNSASINNSCYILYHSLGFVFFFILPQSVPMMFYITVSKKIYHLIYFEFPIALFHLNFDIPGSNCTLLPEEF